MFPPLASPDVTVTILPSTRERLLQAAAEVFARDGLRAATTREIALAAGVNEVTLFRLFKTKQNLLAAVLEQIFGSGSGGRSGGVSGSAEKSERPSDSSAAETELERIVGEYVRGYAVRIARNLVLLRVLMGEIQHFQEHELKVIRGIFLPERQNLIDRLRSVQERGEIREEINLAIVADQLSALVFMGAMRSSLPLPREYSVESYLEASVQTLVQAIGVRKETAGSAPVEPVRERRRR